MPEVVSNLGPLIALAEIYQDVLAKAGESLRSCHFLQYTEAQELSAQLCHRRANSA
ncbi:unnamed protein product, partial [marine sediment metagenome]